MSWSLCWERWPAQQGRGVKPLTNAIDNDSYLWSYVAMYICVCHAVNERRIERAVDEGVTSIKGLCMATRAGTCCGKCLPEAKRHLEQTLKQRVVEIEDVA